MSRKTRAWHTDSPGSLPVAWARQGIQSFVAAQKILMDFAAQENALLVGAVREKLGDTEFRPLTSMVEIAETGVKNLTNVAKTLLDLAAGETTLIAGGAKEALRLPASAGTLAALISHRVETIVEMQKHLLDDTAHQAQSLAESYRRGKRLLPVDKLAELGRHGVEAFVENEKKFLDLAVQEIGAATKGDKRTHGASRDRMKILTEVAREGAEKYIETQRKLLNQLEASTKPNHERKGLSPKTSRASWGELAENSVKNLITAEKSLLDLAMKPVNGPGQSGSRGFRRRASRVAKKPLAGARRVVGKVA